MKFLSMGMLALGVALTCFWSAAANAEFFIDCSETAFPFVDPAYNVDCERFNGGVQAGSESGPSTTESISVTNTQRTIFFTMVDRRITAPHIYMEHRNLSEGFHDAFSIPDVTDWKPVDDKDGYDVAEFASVFSGNPSHCITVQRYTNAMYTGYKRHLIGVGCTIGDLSEVYGILDRLASAGD